MRPLLRCENKENAHRYKSQITLAKRRVQAMEIANINFKRNGGEFMIIVLKPWTRKDKDILKDLCNSIDRSHL